MSRRRPRLDECRTMDDFVRGGFAQASPPNTEEGWRQYTTGRNLNPSGGIVSGASLELHAARALLGTGPGINSPLTTAWVDTAGALDGTLTDFSGSPWAGDGSLADPYRLTFDPADPADYVSAPALAFTGPFGIEAWISPTGAGGYHPIFGCYDGAEPWGASHGYLVFLGGGIPRLQMSDGTNQKDTGAFLQGGDLRDGGMTQVFVVWDGSYIRGYVAGVETASIAWGYGSGTPTAGSLVGKFWGGSFAGDIACVRAYDFAPTPAQVARNFATGTSNYISYSGIVDIMSSGPVAAGTNVAYSRHATDTFEYGPVVVAASAYSAGEQTAIAAAWADIPALFRLVKPGDYLIPLGTDSRAFLRL